MIWLAYTAAKRYERCGELQRQWKEKLVANQVDQKPFFVGRVVHLAFERWLLAGGSQPLPHYLAAAWAEEEGPLVSIPMALRWVEGERQTEWERAARLLVQLEADARGLLKYRFETEKRYRAKLTDDVGMYAQPDILGHHPTEPVLYVIELKSGSSYDSHQVDWYAAVDALTRTAEDRPGVRYVSVALRPATETTVATREVSRADMLAQVERAYGIGMAMVRGEWEPRPQSFCSMCEGRDRCPDYQAKFGGVRAGATSFS